jgi:hypothetical protein
MLENKNIQPLSLLFKEKNGRELIGKNMGQFHTDFSAPNMVGDVFAIASIFIGKKFYYHKLKGKDKDGNVIYGNHIRVKSISSSAINYYCLINKITPYELYKQAYEGAYIPIDLCCGGNKCNFELNSNYTITSRKDFYRSFGLKPK